MLIANKVINTLIFSEFIWDGTFLERTFIQLTGNDVLGSNINFNAAIDE